MKIVYRLKCKAFNKFFPDFFKAIFFTTVFQSWKMCFQFKVEKYFDCENGFAKENKKLALICFCKREKVKNIWMTFFRLKLWKNVKVEHGFAICSTEII